MSQFPKRFQFSAVEQQWNSFWLENNTFKWDKSKDPTLDFSIDTPPPTVSGTLHMGHVYSYTQADIIARYQRLSGKNVLYPIGFDDNGLPTERLVEKTQKIRAGNLPRNEFIDICKSVLVDYEADFQAFFKRLGLSVDWDKQYCTISDRSKKISQYSLLDLYDKGVLERRLEPTLWDPADRTAIAQAEVEEIEKQGEFCYFDFTVQDSETTIEIATTRPELLGGCVALMISDSYPNAQALSQQKAVSPLFHCPVPIIISDKVDPEKGTGAVMCCTFGDITDVFWWKEYKLPLRNIVNNMGKINEFTGFGEAHWPSLQLAEARTNIAALQGLKVKQAKATVRQMLEDQGLLNRVETTQQIIPIAERSGAPLEIIVTPQWFIKTVAYKQQLIEMGQQIQWHPPYMQKRFEIWVENLNWDWCVSRQRYFGVPIPVWYSKRPGEEGKLLFADATDLPVDPTVDLPQGYQAHEVEPETDILDTWATSSMTPILSTFTDDHQLPDLSQDRRFAPMSMRPQAHEIIRSWAFYTIVKSFHHQGCPPWKEINISGWCLAKDGNKMSKSKGNVVDPVKLLDQYGTDVVRYWTGTSKLGHDTTLTDTVLKQGVRLVNKLWNACSFSNLHINSAQAPTTAANDVQNQRIHCSIDRWMLGQMSELLARTTAHFNAHDYAHALRETDRVFWAMFCDNYLEIIKKRLNHPDINDSGRQSAALTLYHVIKTFLSLYAPFMPYITEEIHHRLYSSEQQATASIHGIGNWPQQSHQAPRLQDEKLGATFIELLAAARKGKTLAQVKLGAYIEQIDILSFDQDSHQLLQQMFAHSDLKFDFLSVIRASQLNLHTAHDATVVTESSTLENPEGNPESNAESNNDTGRFGITIGKVIEK